MAKNYHPVYNMDEAIDRFTERRACYNCAFLRQEPGEERPYARWFRCAKDRFEHMSERHIVGNKTLVLAPRCPLFESAV